MLELTGTAVAENVAVSEPAATRTVAGTVTAGEVLVKTTEVPPDGAAAGNCTVQELAAPVLSVEGVQESVKLLPLPLVEVAPGGLMVPAVPDIVIAPPEPSVAATPLRATEKLDAEGAKVSVSEATMPLGIAVAFDPLTAHVYDTDPVVQNIVLPAAVAEAPIEAVIEEMLNAG